VRKHDPVGYVPIRGSRIADRVWRSRSQLELGVVEYIGRYNAARLHASLGDIPPLEYEQEHALREATTLAEAMV
jgi:transposase InsO family protein